MISGPTLTCSFIKNRKSRTGIAHLQWEKNNDLTNTYFDADQTSLMN
jgi:hypothetical protein